MWLTFRAPSFVGAALAMTACNVKAVPDYGDFDGFAWDHGWSGGQDTAISIEADSGVAGGSGEAEAGSGSSCWDEDLGAAVGELVGSGNQADGDNVYDCSGGTGREVVFRWRVPTTDTYTISTHGSPSDTVLELREGCEGASLGCNDDSSISLSSELRVPLDAGVEIMIIADSFSAYSEDLVVVNID
jgi:hypothetical protein